MGDVQNIENDTKQKQETMQLKKEKPTIDALNIDSINLQNDNFKQWKVPKNDPFDKDSVDIDNSDNNKVTSSYLTNIEKEDFNTRSVLQDTIYTEHLYTNRPKTIPCEGMKFSDFEKLKIDLSKSGITVHRSCIENGLSTPHPMFSHKSLQNNHSDDKSKKKAIQSIFPSNKYPFPVPGQSLVSMKCHGLESEHKGNANGGKKKKGKKGKKGKKKKKKK